MTAEKPAFLDLVTELDPAFGDSFGAAYDHVLSDGALPVKTKLLMMAALDAALSHPDGAVSLANRARNEGATEEEVLETLEVVTVMCGLQGLAAGRGSLRSRGAD